MSVANMDEANTVFMCQAETKLKVHSISSPNFKIFSRNVSLLLNSLGEDGQDEVWAPIIRELKRFRFDLSAAPLSQKVVTHKAEALHKILRSKIAQIKLAYGPAQSEMLSVLAQQAQQLANIHEQSLLDTLIHLVNIRGKDETTIVICEPRLILEVEEAFRETANLYGIEIVSPANLREVKCYSRLFVFGAPRWFPEFVFSSPRAKEIHIIKHNWISGKWQPEAVLLSPHKFAGSRNGRLTIEDEPTELGELILEDFIPSIDIKKIQDKATEQLINLVNDDDEIVIARLFLLENDWAVFLETDDNSSVDIIDLDEEVTKRVRRTKVREILPGMYILLRTEGGGDYIVPVADRLMGKFKEKARSEQKRWKVLLREQVKEKGEKEVLRELRGLGSSRATEGNLAHWTSLRGIKTEHYEDFRAIMRLIGLEKEAQKLWETMNEIRKAHSRAGFKIRGMLLDKVNKCDLEKLRRDGIMEFELADQGAGSLSAFRVKEVSKETTEVIHWRIGEPFRIDHG